MGNVRQNSRVEVPVEVINHGAGGAALTVMLTSSCPWIQIDPAALTIPAGQRCLTVLAIAPDAGVSLDDFRHEIMVNAPNGSMVEQLTLEVRGRVIKNITLVAEPAELAFGVVPISNDPVTRSVRFGANDDEHHADIREVTFEAPDGLRHSVEVHSRGDDVYDITVHSANREATDFEGLLVAVDANQDLRPARVRVYGTFIEPPRMRLQQDITPRLEGVRGTLKLPVANVGGQPLTVSVDNTALPTWLEPSTHSLIVEPNGEEDLCLDFNFANVPDSALDATVVLISNDNGYAGSKRRL
ncbi:MAG: hypothetical protein KKI08_21105 [Armatimonadetes bacterium]|nr:hypothetical protein [Armatimonadota bacterium]